MGDAEVIGEDQEPGWVRRVGLLAGAVVFLLLLVAGRGTPVGNMGAVALLMAIWWITDAIPLAATSLLPLVLFPVLGILPGKEVAPLYINQVIFLYIGGFLIALAMERWNLHRRIALTIVGAVGGGPERLVLGFMLATAFLSMWISNTATAVMMLAIGLAVISAAEDRSGPERSRNLSIALLLGIAYAASIGGMATLVGTPPNLSFVRIVEIIFPDAPEIGFGQWLLLGLPISAAMLAAAWFVLVRVIFPVPGDLAMPGAVIREEIRKLGRLGREEAMVLGVFVVTALLWVFRGDLVLGSWTLPGWSRWLPDRIAEGIDDGTVAIGMASLLFLLPVSSRARREAGGHHATVLDARVFAKLPWHIVLLFGGGFALAKGFQISGLSDWIGGGFSRLSGLPDWVLVVMTCLGLTFLTELTSNVATTEMALPILASVATAAGIHPLLLMIPATLSASCAFMLPVATPPNAIIFGSGRLRIGDMVRAGLILNLLGVIVIAGAFLVIGPLVFGTGSGNPPDWAR